jgi:hypothetical protein
MTKALLERTVDDVSLAAFSVAVVDGSGIEVYGEPVTARFDLGAGRQRTVTRRTGADGAAHFVEQLDGAVRSVTLSAGRESSGPIQPQPGASLVIES